MVNLVRLANGGSNAGVNYSHMFANPNENERDIVWGGNGNDVILGDNETRDDYSSDFGFGGNWGSRVPYWHRDFGDFDESEDNIERIWGNMGAQKFDDYFFFGYDPQFGPSSVKYYYDELLIGGDGNDSVFGFAGNDWIVGGAGNDALYGGDDHDMVEGGGGNDKIFVSDADGEFDVAIGQGGNDEITVDLSDYADGGEGLDKLIVRNVDQPAIFDFFMHDLNWNFELLEFHGSPSNDVVRGGEQNDVLYGNGGDDHLEGREGNDTIDGGAGVDYIYGGHGDDTIHGGSQSDVIYDNEGDDKIWGDGGGDIIWTGEGNDTVHGGAGGDYIDEAGKDSTVDSRNNANDILFGDEGTDRIYGGTGRDIIDGGADNDLIVGGLGFDQMKGGAGADTFRFRAEDLTPDPHGTGELTSLDKIMDFSVKDHDTIDLTGLKSLVPGNKLFFDHAQAGPTEAGEVALSEHNGSLWLTVHLDADADNDVIIELAGLNFTNTTIYAMEQLILI